MLSQYAPRQAADKLTARVLGGGPTGALAALALADAGWTVELLDPLSSPDLCQRRRAYALSRSSRNLLVKLGLWAQIEPLLTPFADLQLCDLGAGSSVVFDCNDLPRSEASTEPKAIGWIGRHLDLMTVLLQRLEALPGVCLRLGSDLSETLVETGEVDLVIAADGPESTTRQRLGIGSWRRPYDQACLSAEICLRGAADAQAWELLRPEGPMALLPLGAQRFQLVWSAPRLRCRQLEALSGSAFLDRLAGVLPDQLQVDALLDQPRAYPVELFIARRLHRNRTLLVGESAHRCHPVGGQGLNLCWRDVAVLHRLAHKARRGELNPRRLGASYGRRRWPDLLLTLLATDLLVRVFSNRSPVLLPVRSLALGLLARIPQLRRLALTVMSAGPCAIEGFVPK